MDSPEKLRKRYSPPAAGTSPLAGAGALTMIPCPSCTPMSLTVTASARDVPSSHIFSTRHEAISHKGERRIVAGGAEASAVGACVFGANVNGTVLRSSSGSSTHADSLMSMVLSLSLGTAVCTRFNGPKFAVSPAPEDRRVAVRSTANSRPCHASCARQPSPVAPILRKATEGSSCGRHRPKAPMWSGRRSVVQFPAEQRSCPFLHPHSMRNRQLRFLVVDDFATTRRIIGKLLREIGFAEVDEAADGLAALELLKRATYDFVVTDVDMPRMNGFDLVAAMRRDTALQAIPALLVTREPSKDQVVRASRVGANGYVVRPLTRAGLEDRIRAVLGLPPMTLPRRPGPGGFAPSAMR